MLDAAPWVICFGRLGVLGFDIFFFFPSYSACFMLYWVSFRLVANSSTVEDLGNACIMKPIMGMPLCCYA